MNTFNKINYDEGILLDIIPFDNNLQLHIRLEKTFCDSTNCDEYFIRSYLVGDNQYRLIGYMYFYLNQICDGVNASTYIGTFISPEYRSCGLASLLLSYWISLTRENDYDTLTTIKRQRKPFLLYLLKRYGFDIEDTSEYETADNNIYICSRDNDPTKYLLFQSLQHRLNFMCERVYRHDNYKIIPTSIEDKPWDVSVLDRVLLYRVHNLMDFNASYDLAQKKMHKVKEEGIQIIGSKK